MMPDPPQATASPSAGATRRSGRLIASGAVLLVVLLVAAGALWLAGDQRRADNVASFARAPVGCDTTLDFERGGTFVLFVETTGRIDELGGRCDAALDYDRNPDAGLGVVLMPGLSLTGPDDAPVDLVDAPGDGYDVDGFVGSAIWTVEIDTPGDHVLRVASVGGDPFAIAIGRSVEEGVALLRWAAVAAAIGALVIGGGLIIVGSRRTPAPPEASSPWVPDGPVWPSSPPGFPVPPPTTGAVRPPQTTPERPDRSAAQPPPPAHGRPPTSPWGPPSSPQ